MIIGGYLCGSCPNEVVRRLQYPKSNLGSHLLKHAVRAWLRSIDGRNAVFKNAHFPMAP